MIWVYDIDDGQTLAFTMAGLDALSEHRLSRTKPELPAVLGGCLRLTHTYLGSYVLIKKPEGY